MRCGLQQPHLLTSSHPPNPPPVVSVRRAGKNFDRTYTSPACPVRDHWPGLARLAQLQAKYDPSKVFEPPLMSKVVSGAPAAAFPRCALAKACYCSLDEHCAEGYKCVPSAAFPQYRICKPANLQALG